MIRDLSPADAPRAASLLVEGFREHWPEAFPGLSAGREAFEEAIEPGKICLGAFETGDLAGWIGGMPTYARVWELHPLVVDPSRQRRGIGTALVRELERRVAERGGLTIVLGSDDEDAMTSVSGVELYPDPLEHLRTIRDLKGHPFVFYQRCGFVLSGIVPDANGPGKPDILMAKRVSPGDPSS